MIRNFRRKSLAFIFISSVLALTSCGNEELYYPAAGGGAAASRAVPKSQPLAPPYYASQDPGNIPGVRETHGAASRAACKAMADRFRREGRRLTLKDVIPVSNPTAILKYLCVFEGEDAQSGYYEDNRNR